MKELRRCPYCGGLAAVIHDYDTYDRADFGWSVGCMRYSIFDEIHHLKENDRIPKMHGFMSKQAAIDAWNGWAT